MSEYVYVNAGNDANGNGRRGWIQYTGGEQVAFYDEGNMGRGSIPERVRAMASYASLTITPGQYRTLRKLPTS